MENTVSIGLNRTGLQMSPLSGGDIVQFAEAKAGDAPPDHGAYTAMHVLYAEEADRIGAVPIPGTLKGMATTGIAKFAGTKPEVFIDKLGERLAFERTGTRLYDALILKCLALACVSPANTDAAADASAAEDGITVAPVSGAVVDLAMLRRIRDDEREHFELVRDALTALGADPTAITPCADVAAVMSLGLMQTLTDPRTSLPQSLNAILTAELTDNAGWELLITLANDLGHKDLVQKFAVALENESTHLATVRQWLEKAVLEEAR